MYHCAICKTSDKSIENFERMKKIKYSGHGSCANKTRRFHAPF